MEEVISLHDEHIKDTGGSPGVKDRGLIESALHAPMQAMRYEGPSLFRLAAIYAVRITKNHGFHDGNKRTAASAVRAFLFYNGFRFDPDQGEMVEVFEAIAAGRYGIDDVVGWIEESSRPR